MVVRIDSSPLFNTYDVIIVMDTSSCESENNPVNQTAKAVFNTRVATFIDVSSNGLYFNILIFILWNVL